MAKTIVGSAGAQGGSSPYPARAPRGLAHPVLLPCRCGAHLGGCGSTRRARAQIIAANGISHDVHLSPVLLPTTRPRSPTGISALVTTALNAPRGINLRGKTPPPLLVWAGPGDAAGPAGHPGHPARSGLRAALRRACAWYCSAPGQHLPAAALGGALYAFPGAADGAPAATTPSSSWCCCADRGRAAADGTASSRRAGGLARACRCRRQCFHLPGDAGPDVVAAVIIVACWWRPSADGAQAHRADRHRRAARPLSRCWPAGTAVGAVPRPLTEHGSRRRSPTTRTISASSSPRPAACLFHSGPLRAPWPASPSPWGSTLPTWAGRCWPCC